MPASLSEKKICTVCARGRVCGILVQRWRSRPDCKERRKDPELPWPHLHHWYEEVLRRGLSLPYLNAQFCWDLRTAKSPSNWGGGEEKFMCQTRPAVFFQAPEAVQNLWSEAMQNINVAYIHQPLNNYADEYRWHWSWIKTSCKLFLWCLVLPRNKYADEYRRHWSWIITSCKSCNKGKTGCLRSWEASISF